MRGLVSATYAPTTDAGVLGTETASAVAEVTRPTNPSRSMAHLRAELSCIPGN